MPPTPVSAGTLTDALHWRYATKKFDRTMSIPAATWAVLEEALVLSPSSAGLQPWKFVVVRETATRKRLSEAARGQAQPLDCSHFVVFAGRKNFGEPDIEHYFKKVAEVRGATPESLKGHRDMISGAVDKARSGGYLDTWMSRQVYIALGVFIASAALLGVDACPMEGFEPEKFDEILGLGAMGYGALCACAAGYRSADDKYAAMPKVRFKPEDVIVHV
jgi:nitroreductase